MLPQPSVPPFSQMAANKDQLENLEVKNDELENYFRNTIIPQLFVDGHLLLRKFTPPAMKQFNLSPGDIGRNIGDIVDNFRYPHIIENIETVIATGDILEKEIQTTDFRWYQMNIIPYVVEENNKTNGVIMTFVEITSRIRDLKEQEKLISDYENLVDALSHDLKTPLTSLFLSIDLCKATSADNPEELQFLLKTAENSVIKMKTLIDELTNTRKSEHINKAGEELINIEHILEDVRLTLNDMILKYGVTITHEIHVPQILFSRRKLRSILFNLVSNGIKFRSPDRPPVISIKTRRVEDFVVISVRDNGLGIEKDKQDLIFSKYYRIENSIEGSGLGLYLVKDMVINSGGEIHLESQPGQGSLFELCLTNKEN
jgi:two-component system, OmpR family, phosphate regulon sensor histidine kinase PhoR